MTTTVTSFTFSPDPSDPDNFPVQANGFVGEVPSKITLVNTALEEMDDFIADLVVDNVPALTNKAGYFVAINDNATATTFGNSVSSVQSYRNKIINGQFNINQWDRLPRSAGIDPLILLFESLRSFKEMRFPSSGGIAPVRTLP